MGCSPAALLEWVKKTEVDAVSEQALQAMVSFIDEHRGVFGAEPVSKLLPIAPSTYYENVGKRL